MSSAADTEAKFAMAAELLANGPGSFDKGVALVEQAADAGHAAAACMLATLEAVGAGRPQNWQRAFDYLLLAAELGSDHARAQLHLLSERDAPPTKVDDALSQDWRKARASIDIDRLFSVPERQALSDNPRIRSIPGFASPAECQWIISRARGKLGPALVWDEASGVGRPDPGRSNSALELGVTDTDVVTEVVRARISAAMRAPLPIFETPQVMHYSPGQEFKPHHDFLDPREPGHVADLARRGQRIATFLIYLNDDFEGGETDFPKAGISFRGGTGDALFFGNVTVENAPDPLTLHAGRPPTKGEKWIFSQWIRDRSPAG